MLSLLIKLDREYVKELEYLSWEEKSAMEIVLLDLLGIKNKTRQGFNKPYTILKTNAIINNLNCRVLKYTKSDFLKDLPSLNIDLLCIGQLVELPLDLNFIKEMKRIKQNMKIIVGGSLLTKEENIVLLDTFIDYIVFGEVDDIFYKVCLEIYNDSISEETNKFLIYSNNPNLENIEYRMIDMTTQYQNYQDISDYFHTGRLTSVCL